MPFIRCHCKNTAGRGLVRIADENIDEVFPTQIASVGLDDSQLVTFKLSSGNFIRFQVDTDAQCNVISLALYKEAAKDHELQRVMPGKSQITAYGGATLPVTGKYTLMLNMANITTN